MTATVVRSRAMIAGGSDSERYEVTADGALIVEGGLITEVSTYESLSRKYPNLPVIGTSNDIVTPGFVNAHHHVGLTPFQLGAPDLPLELWVIARMAARAVDPYLDTLYSAFELIGSGVTTVQHICDTLEGSVEDVKSHLDQVITAYRDIGMRASICYSIADQNHFVHQSNEEFLASLPPELARRLATVLENIKTSLEGGIEIFQTLHAEHHHSRRVRVQLAPANLHWCSDRALETLSRTSEQYGVPLHMHLLETPFQREYALSRFGMSAFAYLKRFGLHGPRLTIGHGTWMTPDDIAAAAEAGCSVCINCSSNLRLRGGRARLGMLAAAGVNLAIGIDEAGLNDDRDMLQEMRLVHAINSEPGRLGAYPRTGQMLHMATAGGAATTPFAGKLGAIAPGLAADVVFFDWQKLSYPYLAETHNQADVILRRAKPADVRMVMCDGVLIYANGQFTNVDRATALAELHKAMVLPAPSAQELQSLATALAPFVRRFYRFPELAC